MIEQNWIVVRAAVASWFSWLIEHVPHFQLVAALLAISITVYGFYKAWKFSDRKLSGLLMRHLGKEEKRIHDKKMLILKRLQREPLSQDEEKAFDIHVELDKAVELFDQGKVNKAEGVLQGLKLDLTERYQLAERQAEVAKQQAAAVHLFLGSIAAGREQPDTEKAIQEFEAALGLTPLDFDTMKYLGQQYIEVGRYPEAHALFDRLRELVPEATGKVLLADVLMLQASAWQKTSNNGKARDCLEDSAKFETQINDFSRIGPALKRLAKAEERLTNRQRAISAFERARDAFRVAGNAEERAACQKEIDRLAAIGQRTLMPPTNGHDGGNNSSTH